MTLSTALSSIDDAGDKLFAKLRGKPLYDQIFYWVSFVAEFSILWQVTALLILAPFPELQRQWLRLLIVLLIESVLVNQVVKRLTNRSRPEPTSELTTNPRRPKTTSLPSGHASSATLGAILLSVARPGLAPIFIILAILVGASRIHNRVHHTTDVIAGIATGIFLAVVTLLVT